MFLDLTAFLGNKKKKNSLNLKKKKVETYNDYTFQASHRKVTKKKQHFIVSF